METESTLGQTIAAMKGTGQMEHSTEMASLSRNLGNLQKATGLWERLSNDNVNHIKNCRRILIRCFVKAVHIYAIPPNSLKAHFPNPFL
jgi:hypothetical protein